LWNEKWIDIGGADIGPGAWWTAMFREEWQGSNWNAAYRCPSQPEYTPGAASLLEGKHALSSYWMSTSISVDGTKLEAGCEPYRDAPVVQNRRDAVSYPSSKVELYEAIGFCLKADKNVAEWIDRGQTMQYQTSALMADGSAGRYRRNDYADTSIGNTPFDYTINGIYGRDIVRGLSGTSVFR